MIIKKRSFFETLFVKDTCFFLTVPPSNFKKTYGISHSTNFEMTEQQPSLILLQGCPTKDVLILHGFLKNWTTTAAAAAATAAATATV